MVQENIQTRLKKFGKKGWTLKPYNMWGSDKPCPPRLVVNPYKGCIFQHQYCYIAPLAQKQEGFRDHLQDRIKKAKEVELSNLVVMVSSSTDPFQPIEKRFKDSQFALEQLLENGFPVLVMTRSPQTLLEGGYLDITNHPKLSVDVSIPSLEENNPDSLYYSPIAAPLDDTYDAMRQLSEIGKCVRVKIEPVIPSINGIQEQTEEELDEIIRRSSDVGVKGIISKTMRLNRSVPDQMYEKLIDYYQENGVDEGSTLALSTDLRRELIQPVLDACEKYNVPFCPCVDSDSIEEESCRLGAFGSYNEP